MVFHCFSHENHQKLTTSDRLPAIQRGEGEAVDEETEGHRLEAVLVVLRRLWLRNLKNDKKRGQYLRRKFRSQTSDNMDKWKAEVGRVREEKRIEEKRREENRREEERRSKKRNSQKKEDPGARKGRKVVKHRVWPKICGPGGSKSRLAKVAGAEPCGQMRDEKLHAVVARSKFPSQNVQNTSASEHV